MNTVFEKKIVSRKRKQQSNNRVIERAEASNIIKHESSHKYLPYPLLCYILVLSHMLWQNFGNRFMCIILEVNQSGGIDIKFGSKTQVCTSRLWVLNQVANMQLFTVQSNILRLFGNSFFSQIEISCTFNL